MKGEQALFSCDFYLSVSKIDFMIRISYKLWSLKVIDSFPTLADLFTDKELLHLLRLDVWSRLKHSKNRNQCVTLNREENGPKSVDRDDCHAGVQVISLQISVENMCGCSKVFQGSFKTHWYWFCDVYMLSVISEHVLVGTSSSSEELPKAAFFKQVHLPSEICCK